MGVNTSRNKPGIVEEIDCLSTHAEINALRRASRTDNCVVYIARVNKRGAERQSRPCPKCMTALKNAGCKRIVYTIDSEYYID